ncbi:MAG: YihY/virulence factor BrkB family protein [Bacteroidales bacterium]|nr:YihY/virulence factor BrkB family protein [Bacteroidales bacterium]
MTGKKIWLKYLDRILNHKVVVKLVRISRKVILPGFDGIPVYDVAVFFLRGLTKGSITSRASSIAFNFFLAIFPMIIVFFSIIPFIPIQDFQATLLDLIRQITPENAYQTIESTLRDIILRPRGGLLSLTFVMALYFATNGFSSIIEGFNNTYHSIETRSFLKEKLVAIFLLLTISLIVIIAITLITTGSLILDFLSEQDILHGSFTLLLLEAGRWLVIIAMFFFSISFMYYIGPAKKNQFRFISAGSSLATFLSLAASIGFNFYVKNFSSYNALYGSIGTLLIILVWIYFNAMILLIGFELNASIHQAKQEKTTFGRY